MSAISGIAPVKFVDQKHQLFMLDGLGIVVPRRVV